MSGSAETSHKYKQLESIKPFLDAQDSSITQTKDKRCYATTNEAVLGASSSIHPPYCFSFLRLLIVLSFSFPHSLSGAFLPFPHLPPSPFRTKSIPIPDFVSLPQATTPPPPSSSLPFHTFSCFSSLIPYLYLFSSFPFLFSLFLPLFSLYLI